MEGYHLLMVKYEQIDISGDVGLRVFGESIEVLFENAAAGMYDLITDISIIKETEEKEIVLSAENNDDLLVRWLNELVFLYDTYGFTGKQFTLNIVKNAPPSPSPYGKTAHSISLNAVISGGTFNPDINESRLLIKAATYHNLSLVKFKSMWEATVIFDI
jgi:SHS2 domain-containing protein